MQGCPTSVTIYANGGNAGNPGQSQGTDQGEDVGENIGGSANGNSGNGTVSGPNATPPGPGNGGSATGPITLNVNNTNTAGPANGGSGGSVSLTCNTTYGVGVPEAHSARPQAAGIATAAQGRWVAYSDGRVVPTGGAPDHGSVAIPLRAPIVAIVATPSRGGYWLVGADGGVFTFGDARFFGSAGGWSSASPVVGMSVTPDGDGYWLIAADGGVLPFGAAIAQQTPTETERAPTKNGAPSKNTRTDRGTLPAGSIAIVALALAITALARQRLARH